MTYDPGTGVFSDDDDGFSPLFASHERLPWEIKTDDGEDDGSDDVKPIIVPAGDVPVGSIGSISYDRQTNTVVAGPVELDRTNDVRPTTRGPTKLERAAAERVKLRKAVDTGIGNLRGLAGQHKGSNHTGDAGGTRGPASSLEEAADRFRQSFGRTDNSLPADDSRGVDDRLNHFVTRTLAGKPPEMDKQNWTKVQRIRESEFQKAEFECMVQKVASNTAGDWIVTIKIPYEDRAAATELGSAYGLALNTRMVRKSADT
jgi:hypothetical protein